ncbi:RAVE protein 1 C terminal-domain-containing protein [Phanerochaete sordida]|uniref:RAVE protein 1 C terminal-domain-containing protein n=1 Tax=Phanerochaete sordida TaxID=48140 RepID=A0A9P3LAL7_9APHY|nr:RAVE protein 1 C terminal-domain-containing protein [Phanerochaete sordida]
MRALAFWEAFPGALHGNEAIRCLAVDPGMKLIVATMGTRLATWALSGVQSHTWRVHSTLTLPEGNNVTAVDCKSGLLAVGTATSLSVYTLVLENDLPTWSLKWSLPITGLTRLRFSPSLMYIASTSTLDSAVGVYLTTSGKQTQRIRHPRTILDMNWRRTQASSRDDLILYTITSDATLRVYLPVIDAPHQMQLHASLDVYSAVPFSVASQATSSRVFWLDREVMSEAFTAALTASKAEQEDGRSRRVREIQEESWDLFLRVFSDGSLVVQALANIDRRPPTLLKQFTLLQSPPSAVPGIPDHLYFLPNPLKRGTLNLVTSAPLMSYQLDPLSFFDARSDGLTLQSNIQDIRTGESSVLPRRIARFVRTPDGEGLGILRQDGTAEVWKTSPGGRTLSMHAEVTGSQELITNLAVLQGGQYFVTYSKSSSIITLRSAHAITSSSLEVPPIVSLFPLPSSEGSSVPFIAITETYTVLIFAATLPTPLSTPSDKPDISLSLHSETSLPITAPLKALVPVDPMAWSIPGRIKTYVGSHDILLSVEENGNLGFWIPDVSVRPASWKCTGHVKTNRTEIIMAACSSAKKTILVCKAGDGQELTIWNSTESEFATGLEYRQIYSSSDTILDLDWTATPDGQSILAVGFAHRVELLCQQRMTYFDDAPGWGSCWKIDLAKAIPHQINDSIWLKGGSLLIGTGHLMSLYGQTPSKRDNSEESLFEHVARHNGPLDEYHPQMILQCLLWDKIELVKSVIVNLAKNLRWTRDVHEWKPLPIDEYLQKDDSARMAHAASKPRYSSLFTGPEVEDDVSEDFSPALVQKLVEQLEEEPLPHFTANEQEALIVLIQASLEIERQRRALDSNGLRYLITMRVFYIFNRRLSSPSSPASNGVVSGRTRKRERLRYRDILWAFHSESQELLLSTSVASCEGQKMRWSDARALGVYIWLHSTETMKAHMEVIARNQYMAGDNRDPTECSLFYFALGKVKLVQGLWRQAAWHKEQNSMLKFLNNDFSQPRWKTAALKNAFALLSKRRFEYAAAFFLLGGSLKDAVNVCLRNIQDFQLAIALARVVEGSDDGPVLKNILESTVIPTAFREGNRWLASWAFWMLHRRDLAVRILVTPLTDIANVWTGINEIGESHYDDPSLALLFSQLKLKTLQTAKGTSEISGRTEFNFVLQVARVFCRMGCHALALDLVRTWSFERPSTVVHDSPVIRRPPSPTVARFALEPAMRRQSAIMIDMDIPTEPPTRSASPTPRAPNGAVPSGDGEILKEGDGDLVARKAGMGRLMKSAKQDVQVPEFNMDAFF